MDQQKKNVAGRNQALTALENLRMRLLDLTARNRLINFRHTKTKSLRIIDELPNQLVETLLSDTEIRFLAVPEPTEKELIEAGYLKYEEESKQITRLLKEPTAEVWAKHLGFDTDYEVPEIASNDSDKHSDTAIQTLLYPYEMEARLKSLYQTAELAIQEMGANILYLAFGFLEWSEIRTNHSPRIAPLFLVPVRLQKGRLNRKTKTYEYTLDYSGEDIIPNLSLKEKMRADFGMALPDLDENTVPETYFQEVQKLIQNKQPHWRVRRYISLALLNFSKLLMYLDLDPDRWPKGARIIDHPTVAKFLSGYEQGTENDSGDDIGFGEEHPIDKLDNIHTKYPLIDDADSSQHSALVDAVDGKDLVIEGPPGTGKSQTITNLIAASLAQGKKVLFVAEKLAALEVVRDRLDAAGLGEFCLELHSHKTQKRKMLDDVGERLKKHGFYRQPEDIEFDIARYEELKTDLMKHAEKINKKWKNTGKSLHEIFMAAIRYRNSIGIDPEKVHPDGYDGGNYDPVRRRRNEDQVGIYCKLYRDVTAQLGENQTLQGHPWCGVSNRDLQIFDLDKVKMSLDSWQMTLRELNSEREKITQSISCKPSDLPGTLQEFKYLLTELESIPSLQGDEVLQKLPVLHSDELDKAQRFLRFFLDIQDLYASLIKQVDPKVLQNLEIIDQLFVGNEQLKQLVNQSTELTDLKNAIYQLQVSKEQLENLKEPLCGVTEALGQPAETHLTLSLAGLTDFRTAIDLISILNPSYWKLRSELFDNDELDELLPKFHDELVELRSLHDALCDVFKLDGLPKKFEILQLKNTLEAGGLFKWFKKSWRVARKQIKSYAINAHVKFPVLELLLDKLAEYAGKHQRLNENTHYKEALGDNFRGIDTDADALVALRGWYKSVREQYGIGFGNKVAFGDAILELPQKSASAIRALTKQGIQAQLTKLIDNLVNLKDVFAHVTELHNDRTLLVGEEGILLHLLDKTSKALQVCDPLIEENSLTIADLSNRIEGIGTLKQKVDEWQDQKSNHQELFQGLLDLLKTGVNVDNSSNLSAVQNTLNLAVCLETKLSNKKLEIFIRQNPSISTFEMLVLHAKNLRIVNSSQEDNFEKFRGITKLDWDKWTAQSSEQIDKLIKRNQFALDNGETLQSWLDYVRVRNNIENLGLNRLSAKIESGEVEIEKAKQAYQAGIFDVLAREALREDPELSLFSGHTQEALQEQFREYDNRLKQLQREQIAWQIDQTDIPVGYVGARASDRTERALLEHEYHKQKRHVPIRQLLQRSANALVALKPCFMMGPMSVAQYLEPGKLDFDLVIMDEASQIKPQDALGAIARGRQLIVVGDPKQLPPTSFFDRIADDDDGDGATGIEESESILDATQSIFRARRLRWHYRSQHESLIEFSNHFFYDGDLIIFPSPYKETENYGVQYSRVPRGCFVNRKNLEEARIICEAIREHFRHRTEDTLGVVAMSAEQRLQIERALETLAKEDPVFQKWLDDDSKRRESLFIKNLENVQGDERDVILISMTYGPSEPNGRVFQRFGPINSDVGWRRLNVLFTRSRKRMHVFSSMGSEDVLIGPGSKRGVKALHNFLKYCETGILHKTEPITGREPDSDFEIAVMNALRDSGFECVPQVGVAGFFIDIAVLDPGNPGRYLMGIECDGATYHSAKSTRDRDRLRQSILERLGWKIRRIWSSDWFKNFRGELQPIINELHQLKSEVIPIDEPAEAEEVQDIIEKEGGHETLIDSLISDRSKLEDNLTRFNTEVICKEFPHTPENKRLLRPAMIEALLEHTPTSQVEFLEFIPSYVRQATEASEGKYLSEIFGIINSSLEKA